MLHWIGNILLMGHSKNFKYFPYYHDLAKERTQISIEIKVCNLFSITKETTHMHIILRITYLEEFVVWVDACKEGLGEILMHGGHVIF